jgi:hypothetical protein
MTNNTFELKFKNINNSNNLVYKELINKYFTYDFVRYSSLIIPKSNGADKFDSWTLYLQRASMLIENNIKNLH